jgi:hypothetical protein
MHAPLRPEQLTRLLHDLGVTAPIALRAAATPAQRVTWLLARLRSTDSRLDPEFQQRLCRYVGVRGRLRTRKDALFALVESLKAGAAPDFEQVLRQVSDMTGQVEKSTASHLLALFDPTQPVIDRDLRELLPRYGFAPLGEAPPFEECLEYHGRLQGLFRQVIASPGWQPLSSGMEAALGAAVAALPGVLRLGLLLSHARRPIALLPSAGSEQAIEDARRPNAFTTPEIGGRLHLCR